MSKSAYVCLVPSKYIWTAQESAALRVLIASAHRALAASSPHASGEAK